MSGSTASQQPPPPRYAAEQKGGGTPPKKGRQRRPCPPRPRSAADCGAASAPRRHKSRQGSRRDGDHGSARAGKARPA